jgi:hypothetical protein
MPYAISPHLFGYSVHSATLGKGNSDDTLIKIKNGDMDNKGEVAMVFGKQVSMEWLRHSVKGYMG